MKYAIGQVGGNKKDNSANKHPFFYRDEFV